MNYKQIVKSTVICYRHRAYQFHHFTFPSRFLNTQLAKRNSRDKNFLGSRGTNSYQASTVKFRKTTSRSRDIIFRYARAMQREASCSSPGEYSALRHPNVTVWLIDGRHVRNFVSAVYEKAPGCSCDWPIFSYRFVCVPTLDRLATMWNHPFVIIQDNVGAWRNRMFN